MPNIARKARMAQNLENMRRECPKDYSFYPRTWILPTEHGDFKSQFDAKGKSSKVYIIKPDAGCQGRGIFLTQDVSRVPLGEPYVAQQYIRRPLLIEGFKFDLRLYVLVASVKPLRMYLFHNGLVRMCTDEYVKPTAENLGNTFMHLTNYAINKKSDNFMANDGEADGAGSKRSLRWFMEWVAGERGEEAAAGLWQRMGALCVKVVLSILPTLQREYGETFDRARQLREFRRRAEATEAAERAAQGHGGAFGGGRDEPSYRAKRAAAEAAAAVALEVTATGAHL